MSKRVLFLQAGLLFFFALSSCNHTFHGQQSFEETVNPKALRVCDSLYEIRIDMNDPKAFNPLKNAYLQLSRAFPFQSDSATHAMIQLELANLFGAAGQPDSAIAYSEKILPFFEAHQQWQKPLIRCYSILGMNLRNIGQSMFTANRYATQAAALLLLPGADTFFSFSAKAQIFYSAAASNSLCDQHEQALRFAREAYRLMKENDTADISPYMRIRPVVELFQIHTQMKQFDSARKYVDEAVLQANAPAYEAIRPQIRSLQSSYFFAIQQYDSALHYLSPPQPGSLADSTFYIYVNLGCHTLLGHKKEAAYYYDMAQRLGQSNPDWSNADNDYAFHRAQYLTLYGDRKEALRALGLFDSLSSDIYNKQRLEMFASIESEYDLADKKKNIEALNRVNAATKSELRKKNTFLLITILVALLVTIVVIALLLLVRQRRLRSEKQQLEADRNKIALEQRLLRTQMEPHFIFNTLAVLQSQVYHHEYEKAGAYLGHFSRLLRTSLENSREDFVLLHEEIEALNAYLALQQLRFENAFDYTIRLYDGYEEDTIYILPMLLQPFAENAIQYGLAQTERLKIIIAIDKKGPLLHCVITDNGGGIRKERTQPGKKSLSTQIIRERLAILSGQSGHQASLEMSNTTDGTGTIITLIFPYLQQETLS